MTWIFETYEIMQNCVETEKQNTFFYPCVRMLNVDFLFYKLAMIIQYKISAGLSDHQFWYLVRWQSTAKIKHTGKQSVSGSWLR